MKHFTTREYACMSLHQLKSKYDGAYYEAILKQVNKSFENWGEYLVNEKARNVYVIFLHKKGITKMGKYKLMYEYEYTYEDIDDYVKTNTVILTGYLVTEPNPTDYKRNPTYKYIKVVKSLFGGLGVASCLISRVSRMIKKRLLPMQVIEQSVVFWKIWFGRTYGLKTHEDYDIFKTSNNVSVEIDWEKII